MKGVRRTAVAMLLAVLAVVPATAAEVTIAVAANFTAASKEIALRFEEATKHTVELSFGASGQLYAQVKQGAPFDILMSADTEFPRKLADEGLAVADTRFTYAVGKLVLWSLSAGRLDDDTLRRGAFAHIAIADPFVAPYGAAAIEVLKSLGLEERLRPKFVQGATISQTFEFIASGNADLGFVALSQLAKVEHGSRWDVPDQLYTPIRQDAILLKAGAKNAAAVAFLAFLKGPEATAIVRRYGYGVAD